MSKIEFPKNFLWGGAMASEQYEGKGTTGKGKTKWDKHFEMQPEDFWDQIGPSITSDGFNRYESDIELFKSFGVNSVRIGISWARVYPDGINLSQEGIDFYKKIVDKFNKEGIKPILNLFHFDMPLWAFELGGWENREVIASFKIFASKVFEIFVDKVEYFITFNEPAMPILNGFQSDTHLPKVKDNARAINQSFGMLLAHSVVVKLFNEKYSNKAKIGVVINVAPAIAKDGKTASDDDKLATWKFDLFHNNFWLYPMVKGEWPKGGVEFLRERNLLPKHNQEELEIIKQTKIDFLGTNFYAPNRVVAPASDTKVECLMDESVSYHLDTARYNVFRGWEIRPESLYDIATIVRNEFDNIPFFISENGMGVENEEQFRGEDGQIKDDYRISFLKEHLQQLAKAIDEGSNCFGYHMWAITDNWSWRNAYKNRYGFVEINIKDQSRKLKKSAEWFGNMIKENGYDDNFPKIEETIDLTKTKYSPSVQ